MQLLDITEPERPHVHTPASRSHQKSSCGWGKSAWQEVEVRPEVYTVQVRGESTFRGISSCTLVYTQPALFWSQRKFPEPHYCNVQTRRLLIKWKRAQLSRLHKNPFSASVHNLMFTVLSGQHSYLSSFLTLKFTNFSFTITCHFFNGFGRFLHKCFLACVKAAAIGK